MAYEPIHNEDYISMFRPGDYRQVRLPFLMKESTVLMVGYGFGDINVISAVDWSRNVYQNIIETCDTDIIQLLYCDPDQDTKTGAIPRRIRDHRFRNSIHRRIL